MKKGKSFVYGDDVDTDVIIPARYLNTSVAAELAEHCMEDIDKDFHKNVQNDDFIIAGDNFGCGSSREHAPQAIKRAGYEAVIAESFAEIFYGNSSVLGLVCITMPKAEISEFASYIEKNPDTEVIIDIEKAEIKAGDKIYKAGIKPALQKSLLDGTYDTIYELMKNKDKIEEMDKNLPPKCFN